MNEFEKDFLHAIATNDIGTLQFLKYVKLSTIEKTKLKAALEKADVDTIVYLLARVEND
jgi:hypothetical protein